MGAEGASFAPGARYVWSRSLGQWPSAVVLSLLGALLSGFLYALCLMAEPIRPMWMMPGRSVGPVAGLAGGVCSTVGVALFVFAILRCRVASRWFVRVLSFGVGMVIMLTCFVVLLGQAPLGDAVLVARRPVEFREVTLGQGAYEVLAQPADLAARVQGLRAVSSSDKVLLANVLLGALVCAAVVGDIGFRLARRWSSDFMLDERTGDWFCAPVEARYFWRLEESDPTVADLPDLVPLEGPDEAEDELIDGRSLFVLFVHPSKPELDRRSVLVSLDEVSLHRRRFLRRVRARQREVIPPTFVEPGLLEALMQGRS